MRPMMEQAARTPAAPVLWLAPTSALYAGPPLSVGVHRGAVACLGQAEDGTLAATTATRHTTGPSVAVLVRPGVAHRIDAECKRALFLYMHPTDALVRSAEALTDALPSTRELQRSDRCTLRALVEVAGSTRTRLVDPRIQRALAALDDGQHLERSVAQFAAQTGLSHSRFMHLFAACTGVPFRRYRLWARLRAATIATARGASLTAAALDAGFATPSHFSEAFRSMFGVAPSSLRAMSIIQSPDTRAAIEAALRG